MGPVRLILGTLGEKGSSPFPSWSKLKKTDKLKLTPRFEVYPAFGYREIIALIFLGHFLIWWGGVVVGVGTSWE